MTQCGLVLRRSLGARINKIFAWAFLVCLAGFRAWRPEIPFVCRAPPAPLLLAYESGGTAWSDASQSNRTAVALAPQIRPAVRRRDPRNRGGSSRKPVKPTDGDPDASCPSLEPGGSARGGSFWRWERRKLATMSPHRGGDSSFPAPKIPRRASTARRCGRTLRTLPLVGRARPVALIRFRVVATLACGGRRFAFPPYDRHRSSARHRTSAGTRAAGRAPVAISFWAACSLRSAGAGR
jgi:hypothetical protein